MGAQNSTRLSDTNTHQHTSTNHSSGENYCGGITPGQCMQSAAIVASLPAADEIVTWVVG